MPGTGVQTLTGRLGYLDPSFHRHTDVHLHAHAASGRQDGTSVGAAMGEVLRLVMPDVLR